MRTYASFVVLPDFVELWERITADNDFEIREIFARNPWGSAFFHPEVQVTFKIILPDFIDLRKRIPGDNDLEISVTSERVPEDVPFLHTV